MNCTDCQDLLLDLAYGELAPDQAAAVQSHAQGCAECGPEYLKLQGARQALAPLLTALRAEEQPGPGFDDKLLAAARGAAEQQAARPKAEADPRVGSEPAAPVPEAPAPAQVLSLDAARLKRRGWLRAAVGVSVAAAAGLALVVGSSQKGPPVKLGEEPVPAVAKAAPAPAAYPAQAAARPAAAPEVAPEVAPTSGPPKPAPALAGSVAGPPGAEQRLEVIAQQAHQKEQGERAKQAAGWADAERQAALEKSALPGQKPAKKAKKAAGDDETLSIDDGGLSAGGGLAAFSGAGAAGVAAGAGAAANIGAARGALSGGAAKDDAPLSADKFEATAGKKAGPAAAPKPSAQRGRDDLGVEPPPSGRAAADDRKAVQPAQATPPVAAKAEAKPAAPAKVVAALAPPPSQRESKGRQSALADLDSSAPEPKGEAVRREAAASPLAGAEIQEQQAASSADSAAAARLWLRAGRLRAQGGDTEGAARDYSRAVEGFVAARLAGDARQAYDLLSALSPAQPAPLARARAVLESAAAEERASKAARKARPAAADAGKATDQGY
jgi:hypothetical protein